MGGPARRTMMGRAKPWMPEGGAGSSSKNKGRDPEARGRRLTGAVVRVRRRARPNEEFLQSGETPRGGAHVVAG